MAAANFAVAAAAICVAFLGASEAHGADDRRCYDVKVVAHAIQQIPSVAPELGPNQILAVWPWFLDLQVTRVLAGRLSGELVNVLSVQHTDVLPEDRTWWLRRNTAGTYNAIYPDRGERLRRCSSSAIPVEPYLIPAAGKTLQQYREEGAQHYRDWLEQRQRYYEREAS